MTSCMANAFNSNGFSSNGFNPNGFNPNARSPFRLSCYQAATVWISDFRAKWGRWPTRGNCPADGVQFSRSTFCAALKELKEWEGRNTDGESD